MDKGNPKWYNKANIQNGGVLDENRSISVSGKRKHN